MTIVATTNKKLGKDNNQPKNSYDGENDNIQISQRLTTVQRHRHSATRSDQIWRRRIRIRRQRQTSTTSRKRQRGQQSADATSRWWQRQETNMLATDEDYRLPKGATELDDDDDHNRRTITMTDMTTTRINQQESTKTFLGRQQRILSENIQPNSLTTVTTMTTSTAHNNNNQEITETVNTTINWYFLRTVTLTMVTTDENKDWQDGRRYGYFAVTSKWIRQRLRQQPQPHTATMTMADMTKTTIKQYFVRMVTTASTSTYENKDWQQLRYDTLRQDTTESDDDGDGKDLSRRQQQ